MTKITLHRLILQNFKGFTFLLDAGDYDTNVYGANATGKTTLADAFSWLLFDKDSLGRSDFEIKNLDAMGNEEHGLEHSVEGLLSINGNLTSLKKIYREIWSKKRGSAQATFTGHTTEYFIDGVPVQKKDYTAQVTEIAGDEAAFKLLTSPTVFPSLHWQKQRALLLEICGDITDAQVIESDSKLIPLLEILGKRSIDDHRKVIASRRNEINKELERIPVRIDEVRRGLPDTTGLNRKAIEADIQKIETSLNDAKLRLQGIDTGGNIAELTKKLSIINSDIQRLEQAYYNDAMKTVNRLNQQITEITEKIQTAARQKKAIEDAIHYKEGLADNFEAQLEKLRGEWTEADEATFQDTTEDTCPACGQSLPSDRVQEAREKALAEWNRRKAERMTDIERRGKAIALERDKIKEDIQKHNNELAAIVVPADDVQSLITERDSIKRMAEDYSTIKERAPLLEEKADVEAKIRTEKEGRAIDTVGTTGEINTLTATLKEAKDKADRFRQREQGEKRIEELKQSEKVLAAEYEKLEQELYLTEEFVRTKVKLLTDRINSRFEIARFRLFNALVNGGLEECCEITVNGVPYSSGLNNAARINAGLDVCRTLSQHYGLLAPIFVDNAESVCELIKMDTQVVRLIVSEQDKILRVETAPRDREAA